MGTNFKHEQMCVTTRTGRQPSHQRGWPLPVRCWMDPRPHRSTARGSQRSWIRRQSPGRSPREQDRDEGPPCEAIYTYIHYAAGGGAWFRLALSDRGESTDQTPEVEGDFSGELGVTKQLASRC